MSIVRVECEVTVVIDVDEILCPNVITRCTENEDGWRDQLYDLQDRDDVLRHLAFNVVMNGVEDIRRLDGWADVPEDAVRMRVDRLSFSALDVRSE